MKKVLPSMIPLSDIFAGSFFLVLILSFQCSFGQGKSETKDEAYSRSIRLEEYKKLSQPIIKGFYESQKKGSIQATIPWLAKLGSLARQLDLPEKECRAYGNIARSYHRLGEMDSAFFWNEKAIELRPVIPPAAHEEVVKVILEQGKLCYDINKPLEGTKWLREVLDMNPDSIQLSEAYGLLGSCQGLLGNYQEQLSLSDSAFVYAPQKGTNKNIRHRAYLLFIRSKVFWKWRDLEQQIDLLNTAFKTSLMVQDFARDWGKVADIHNDLAVTWGIIGNWERERKKLKSALKIINQYYSKDDSKKATLFYNLGLSFGRKRSSTSWKLTGSNLDSSSTNLDSSKYYLRQALAIWNQHPKTNKFSMAKAYGNLSVLAGREDSLELQLSFANKGLNLTRDVYGDNHPEVALAWTRRAACYEKKEKYHAALQDLQSAIRAAQEPDGQFDPIGNPYANSLVYKLRMVSILKRKAGLLAQLAEEEGDSQWLSFAFQTSWRAVETVNLIREDQVSSIRTGTRELEEPFDMMSLAIPVYEQGLELAWQLYGETGEEVYFEKAFVISELSKAVFLTAGISERSIREIAGIPDSLVNHEMACARLIMDKEGKLRGLGRKGQELRIRIQKADTALQKEQTQADLRQIQADSRQIQADSTQVQADLFDLREEYRQLKRQIAQGFPDLKALRGTLSLPSIEEVRNQYAGNSSKALLEYFYGEAHIYVLGIGREKLYFNRIALDAKLDAAIDTVLHSLQSPAESPDYAPAASHLTKTLLLDPLNELEVSIGSQLLIIPDGKLCRLPFGALVKEKNCRLDGDCRFLIEDYEFYYKYSLQPTLNYAAGKQRYSQQRTYLGYLDLFQGKDNKYDYLEDFQESMQQGEAALGGLVQEESNTTQQELMAFLEQCPLPAVLYFVSHGLPNPNPWDACLVLGMSISPEGDTIMERLSVYDMMFLQLPVEMLILPACFSADNLDRGGQGPISLASASQFAGAKSLVTSLWETDVSTADDMISDFLVGIANNQSRSHALALAQKTYLSRLQNRHPHYWANLILIGDAEPLPKPSHPLLAWLTLAGTLLFMLLLATFYSYQNRLI